MGAFIHLCHSPPNRPTHATHRSTNQPLQAPTRSLPQKSWADDDDEFIPVRPTVQKEVTYPAPARTAAGPSRDGGFGGGATAAARDFRCVRLFVCVCVCV